MKMNKVRFLVTAVTAFALAPLSQAFASSGLTCVYQCKPASVAPTPGTPRLCDKVSYKTLGTINATQGQYPSALLVQAFPGVDAIAFVTGVPYSGGGQLVVAFVDSGVSAGDAYNGNYRFRNGSSLSGPIGPDFLTVLSARESGAEISIACTPSQN